MAKAKAKSATLSKPTAKRAKGRGANKHVAALKKMAATARAVVGQQTELRALTLFESLPPGHSTFLVTGDRHCPHLRPGEYAVIDTLDRELQNGELYLIQYKSGPRRREILHCSSSMCNITGLGAADSLVWWLRELRGYRKTEERVMGVPLFAGLSDGPYTAESLQPKLVGRVVGFAFKSLGQRIAPEAGYCNEAQGNADFDPAEYLDVLIRTGHSPRIEGKYYFEGMPDRARSEAEHARVFAVRLKFAAASTALERVKQECIRRGLVDDRRAA